MSARHQSQLNLPPSLLPNREPQPSLLPKQEHQPQALTNEPDALAAAIFDEALDLSGISSQEAGYLIGVSESMVRKMRSATTRERVSFAQELRLPLQYHLAKHKVMDQRFGFGRRALLDLLTAAGALALVMER